MADGRWQMADGRWQILDLEVGASTIAGIDLAFDGSTIVSLFA